MPLKLSNRMSLYAQSIMGWATFPLWGGGIIAAMRLFKRYQIDGLAEVRHRFDEIRRSAKGPILLCVNHLTKIDSVVLNWALASVSSYMRDFRRFSWNMPERARYHGHPVLRMLCYLGQCIPVDRGGSREAVKQSLEKVSFLLRRGHMVTLFPEGSRSRSGRVDTEGFSYGPGRLIRQLEPCTALCVYLRGHNQVDATSLPPRGAKFYLQMDAFQPTSAQNGLRATRDIAAQIVHKLSQMEQAYFAARGQ